MKKKRVLILCASLKIGGAEKVARDIALYADPEEYEFHYLVLQDSIGEYEAELTARGCVIHRLEEPSHGYFKFLKDLSALLHAEQFHIVHAHTMFNCGWAMLCARLAGVPIRVAHAHSALKNGHNPIKAIYEKVMQLLILTCSTDLVACGVAAGERLFGKRAFRKRGNLVLNGVDIHGFRYQECSRNSIRESRHAQERFILGHAGHLNNVKNQVFLLNLLPSILMQKPNALLLLLGEGEDRPMLEARIAELGLQDHVILTGNVPNVADYLSAMDVFVFPSLFEGMPLAILEVQANGLPCVISDSVPNDVFLTDLIMPLSLNDPAEKWCDTICSVHRNHSTEYGQKLLDSDFSINAAMEKIYRIYQKGNLHD